MKALESKIKKITGVYLARYEVLKTQKGDISQTIVPIINLKEEMFEKLKAFISTYTFTNDAEEIYFFKEIKPKLLSRLIFYKKLYCFETKRPVGSTDVQLRYIEKELNRLTDYHDLNLDFYVYYRSGNTNNDHFFLRGNCPFQSDAGSFHFECDMRFSSCLSRKSANLQANELFQTYLEQEMQRLQTPSFFSKEPFNFKSKETWTHEKIDLVELIYAISETKCLNHGKITLKSLTDYFSSVFNIELGTPYQAYSELKERKNCTRFLDELKANLQKKINAEDG